MSVVNLITFVPKIIRGTHEGHGDGFTDDAGRGGGGGDATGSDKYHTGYRLWCGIGSIKGRGWGRGFAQAAGWSNGQGGGDGRGWG